MNEDPKWLISETRFVSCSSGLGEMVGGTGLEPAT